jgi:HrpA-like RNA helicase
MTSARSYSFRCCCCNNHELQNQVLKDGAVLIFLPGIRQIRELQVFGVVVFVIEFKMICENVLFTYIQFLMRHNSRIACSSAANSVRYSSLRFYNISSFSVTLTPVQPTQAKKYRVLVAHSSVSLEDQSRIYERTNKGTRKIVISRPRASLIVFL